MNPERQVTVAGIGMATPVGMSAAQSCAAIRAGISAMTELDYFIMSEDFEEAPLMGGALPAVTEGYAGVGRWTRLGAAAMQDLIESCGLTASELSRAGLYLALPPLNRAGIDSRIAELLPSRIASAVDLDERQSRRFVYPQGHASAARAYQDAIAHVLDNVVPYAIVLGIDSLIESATLEFFNTKRRLKTVDWVDGFIPGEAAACVLLERRDHIEARGARALARIGGAHVAVEPITIWSTEPSQATGLSDAVRGTLDELREGVSDIQLAVCDLNGETYRAKEYGVMASRALSRVASLSGLWHPADCIGDTGAASFVVATCITARGFAKGYAKGKHALVFGSSDDGLRGAVALSRDRMEA